MRSNRLEKKTGANSYITIIGSRRWAPVRINVAQAFNGIGTTISPIVASYAFFGGNDAKTSNLDSVKWTYVGVGCGTVKRACPTMRI